MGLPTNLPLWWDWTTTESKASDSVLVVSNEHTCKVCLGVGAPNVKSAGSSALNPKLVVVDLGLFLVVLHSLFSLLDAKRGGGGDLLRNLFLNLLFTFLRGIISSSSPSVSCSKIFTFSLGKGTKMELLRIISL